MCVFMCVYVCVTERDFHTVCNECSRISCYLVLSDGTEDPLVDLFPQHLHPDQAEVHETVSPLLHPAQCTHNIHTTYTQQ